MTQRSSLTCTVRPSYRETPAPTDAVLRFPALRCRAPRRSCRVLLRHARPARSEHRRPAWRSGRCRHGNVWRPLTGATISARRPTSGTKFSGDDGTDLSGIGNETNSMSTSAHSSALGFGQVGNFRRRQQADDQSTPSVFQFRIFSSSRSALRGAGMMASCPS